MLGKGDKVFFPGLNGLRFFAASAVIITHIELLKGQIGFPNHWNNPIFYNLGGLGVYFFFVLSGFLITYLLLREKEMTGKINIRDFYLRRIFRIWPIYYLMVILAFFIFPHFGILSLDWFDRFLPDGYWLKFVFYLLLLPNLALAIYPSVPHAGQLWSIGVEEQFYIIWPWLIRSSRKIARTIILFGVTLILFKCVVLAVCHYYPHSHVLQSFKAFVAMTKMECMAIGGLGGWIIFAKKERLTRMLFHPITQISAYLTPALLIFFTPEIIQDGIHIVYAFAFLIIIMNIGVNERSFLKLSWRIFDHLGNISYAMYMYHMFVVVFTLRMVHHYLFTSNHILLNIEYYLFTFLITIALSSLSYYFYEKPFIRMKKRFTRIISGTEARDEK